jgi:hypothetical protein
VEHKGEGEPEVRVLIEVSGQVRNPGMYSLGHLMSWVVSRIDDMSAALEQLAADVEALRAAKERPGRGDAPVRQLDLRVNAAEEKITEVDSRLDEIMAHLDSVLVRGRQEERDADHYTFSREFTSLVNNDIGTLVQLIAERHGLQPRDRARLTGRICWHLFAQQQPLRDAFFHEIAGEPSVVLKRAERILALAEDLRRRMAGYRNQYWDFGFQPGMPVDPSYQEKWSYSPAGNLVEFVVVPCYTVDGYSILSKQSVYAGDSDKDLLAQGPLSAADNGT